MDTILLSVICAFMGLLLLIRLVFRLSEHGKDVRYLKKEIKRASNEAEYRRWKDKLTVARWNFYTGLPSEMIERRIKRKRKKRIF